MGQANKRGTLEQRVEQARDKFESSIDTRKQEIAELEAFEARQNAAMQQFINTQVFPQMERQHGALMRVDFTKVPLSVTKEALDKQQEAQ